MLFHFVRPLRESSFISGQGTSMLITVSRPDENARPILVTPRLACSSFVTFAGAPYGR